MELQERINVLIQGAELAQKAGVLSLDDAYYAKQAIDALKNGISLKDAFEVLIQVITIGQKKGVYTLRDSHLLYLAVDNYETFITPPVKQPVPQEHPVPQTEEKKPTKKES